VGARALFDIAPDHADIHFRTRLSGLVEPTQSDGKPTGIHGKMTANLVITMITLALIVNISLMHTSLMIKLLLDLILAAALVLYWIVRLGYARKKVKEAGEP
jgi:Flp pilus assembly protein TadB